MKEVFRTMNINIAITKGARQFGYLIWNNKNGIEIEKLLEGLKRIHIKFNDFDLGEKNIDSKYHRISLGYKLTRAMPEEHNMYFIYMENGILEVKSYNGNNREEL